MLQLQEYLKGRLGSGKVVYEAKWNGYKGSIIYADGMLYCYDENTGDVALVRPSPKGFDIISSFRITEGDGQHWAHPAISDSRLYIRHGNALMAFDIKRKQLLHIAGISLPSASSHAMFLC